MPARRKRGNDSVCKSESMSGKKMRHLKLNLGRRIDMQVGRSEKEILLI